MRLSRRSITGILPCVLMLGAAGCETTRTIIKPGMGADTTVRMGKAPGQPTPANPPAEGRVPDADDIGRANPSATRLHDIAGAILLYFAVNRSMPKQLSDLQSVQDLDVQLDTTSPVSHQPYIYVPEGLTAPGHNKRIIIYDPLPMSNGKRWCIFAADAGVGQAQSLEPVLTPEAIFKEFLPAGK